MRTFPSKLFLVKFISDGCIYFFILLCLANGHYRHNVIAEIDATIVMQSTIEKKKYASDTGCASITAKFGGGDPFMLDSTGPIERK